MVRKGVSFLVIVLFILKLNNKDHLIKYESNILLNKETIENEKTNIEEIKNNDFINKQEEYIAILEIPSINLKKGIYSKESTFNVVNNIKVLNESTFPDIQGGNLILAGHSGSGIYAHFNDLYKLKVKELINLYYKNNKYQFEIIDIYEIEKTGKALIKDNYNTNLTLITCKGNSNQIIIIADLKI